MERVVNDAVHQALALLAIDSPSGYTGKAAEYVYNSSKSWGLTLNTAERVRFW